MKLLRIIFDTGYNISKPFVFAATKKDPEKAHALFVSALQTLYKTGLDKLVLESTKKESSSTPSVCISNAAGFNKNGEIPPQTLGYLGFDRVVVGTVTYDSWQGNPRPRTLRIPKTNSLVNWMGLPGVGAQVVAQTLADYKPHTVPITVNLMSTPQKSGDELLKDLEGTTLALRDNPNVDRFELNISCPNTHAKNGDMDARKEYQNGLSDMLQVMNENMFEFQQLYVKVSPDLDYSDVQRIAEVVSDFRVAGYTTTNTSSHHNKKHIPNSPGKGGASGDAVYTRSCFVQHLFSDYLFGHPQKKIIACGGIDSVMKAKDRTFESVNEIQLYTPLIFKGPRLLRELKEKL